MQVSAQDSKFKKWNSCLLFILNSSFWTLIFVGLQLFSPCIWAVDKTLDVSHFNQEPISLTDYFAVFEDFSTNLTLADIQTTEIANRFETNHTPAEAFNYGITHSAYWFRLTLHNSDDFPVERMIEIRDARLSSVIFYQKNTANVYLPSVTGMNYPFSSRSYKNRYFVFPVTLPAHSHQTYYFRIASIYSLIIPAKLWSPDNFHTHERNDYLVQTWYFGIVTAMILFNLLLFIMLRDVIYLLYVIYVTFFSFYVAAMNGLGREFLWIDLPLNPDISSSEFFYLAIITLLLFIRKMLNTQKVIPIGDVLIQIFIGIYLLQFIVCPIQFQLVINPKINYLHLTLAFFTLAIGVLCVIKRQRSAYFFLIAFFMFFLGGLLMSLRTLNVLPTNIFTVNGFQFGSAWEMLLLAFALADRFNVIRKDREKMHTELVENLQASEQILETRVNKRTAELQMLNRELNQKERYLRALIDNFPFMVWLKDTESRFLAVNQFFAKNFGEDNTDNMLGKTDFDYSPKELAESYREDDCFILTTKQQKTLEEQITNHSGEHAWFETFKAPVLDSDGKALGTVGFARDISIRKQIEKVAEELDRSKSNFFANMSHEIRTPMNGIIGLSRLALKKEVSTEVRNYLEKIYKSSNDLLSILNNLLDFSKLEADGVTLDYIAFELNTILDNAVNLFANDTDEKNITFKTVIAPDVPNELVGDATKLRQVLINLISNAKKFTEEGEIVTTVDMQQRIKNIAELRFGISDTGIGMTAAQIEKLFHPFSQVDTSITRKYGGTGLGLSICKQLVELMGGELHVTSVYGKGSTFEFVIPLTVEAGQVEANASELNRYPMSYYNAQRVLLVEDNEINQLVAEELLTSMGLQVQIANNGKDGVEQAFANPFDLILMDIQMPIMDGLTATQLIRAEPSLKNIPILAMTAHAMESDLEKSLAAGMNAHLTKPIEIDKLVAVLNSLLNIHTNDATQNLSLPTQTVNLLPEFLPPFDLAQALIFCNGNATLLHRSLLSFCNHYADAVTELANLINTKNFSQAKYLAHSIKGVAGTLAAEELKNAAAEFETALKAGWLDRIPPLLDDFTKKLSTAVRAAQSLQPLPEQTQISNLKIDELNVLFEQLKHALSNNHFKAIDIFAELKPYLLQYDLQQIAEELTYWLENLDFPHALLVLDDSFLMIKEKLSLK